MAEAQKVVPADVRSRRPPRVRVARAGLPMPPLPPCRTGLPRPVEPITERHLERALEIMAGIVVQHGEVMSPLYVRLEAELEAARRRRGPVERARQLLVKRGRNVLRPKPEASTA